MQKQKQCQFCHLATELEDHLCAECVFTRNILRESASWWNIATPDNSLNLVLSWGEASAFYGNNFHVFKEIIFSYLWHVWKARNDLVHDKKKVPFIRTFLLIQ